MPDATGGARACVPPQRPARTPAGTARQAAARQQLVDVLDADVAVWRRIVDTVQANAEYPWPPTIDQKCFAEIIGVGRRPPTTSDLALIANYYQVTVAWLLTGDDQGLDGAVSTELQECICGLRKRAQAAEKSLALSVAAIRGAWEIVVELRNAAVADGRGTFGDPMAERLAAALRGTPGRPCSKAKDTNGNPT